MSFISVENVKFSYDEDKNYVLNGLNLKIEKGEFVALLGHNGCGKSTAAKLLNAMFLPDEGVVVVDDMNTSDEKLTYEIRRNDAFPLARAGQCIRIDASADVGGLTMPDQLQMVYILPAADGCRIATVHYAAVASEGFGRRFRYLMDTFSVIPLQTGDGSLSGA